MNERIPPAVFPAYVNLHPGREADEENRAWQGCPSIAVTRGGRMFAAFFTGGLFEPCILNYNVLIQSDDGGESWTKPILTVHSDYGMRMRNFDMEIWITPENHLWVMWAQSPYYETSQLASIRNPVPCDYWLAMSSTIVMVCKDPDAKELKWEQPRYLCDGCVRNRPIVTSSGRIIVPAYDFGGDSYVLRYSDDHGKHFRNVTVGKKPRTHTCDELAVYEHGKELTMIARSDEGCYLRATSRDGGESWGEILPHEASPSMRCFVGTLKNGMVAYIRSISDTQRIGLKLSLSEDGGKTYPYTLMLDERENVSYPELAEAEDGSLYVIYDRERDNRLLKNTETWTSTAAKEILLCKLSVADVISGTLSDTSYLARVISKAKINDIAY